MDVQVTRELTCLLLRALRAGYRRARPNNPRQRPTRGLPRHPSPRCLNPPEVTREHTTTPR